MSRIDIEKIRVPEEEQPYKIPDNWEWVKFEGIFDNMTSSKLKIKEKEYLKEGKYPIIDQGKTIIGGYSNMENYQYSGELPVIIFGDHTRNIKYIDFKFIQGADGVKVLKPKKNILEKYSYYMLKNINIDDLGYRRHFSILKQKFFPLPPLEEQKRIVQKVEAMLDKLSQAKELIAQAKESFEMRKASVLNLAFSGELTKKWREKNSFGSGAELLEKVQSEKMRAWEEECRKAEERGEKKPKKVKISTLDEMRVAKEEQPYEIPESWEWVRLGEVIELLSGRDISNNLCNNNKIGIPYIMGASNIIDNKFIAERWIENPTVISKENDILITVKGTIGKLYLQQEKEIHISRQIMAIRGTIVISRMYIFNFLRRNMEKIKMEANGLIPGISREDILNLSFPLPPLEEQKEIVRIVESVLKNEEEIQSLLEMEREIEMVEKAILDRAFRGALGTNCAEERVEF